MVTNLVSWGKDNAYWAKNKINVSKTNFIFSLCQCR